MCRLVWVSPWRQLSISPAIFRIHGFVNCVRSTAPRGAAVEASITEDLAWSRTSDGSRAPSAHPGPPGSEGILTMITVLQILAWCSR